jgi:hypothetical protein
MPFALGNMQQARGLYRRSGIGFKWQFYLPEAASPCPEGRDFAI